MAKWLLGPVMVALSVSGPASAAGIIALEEDHDVSNNVSNIGSLNDVFSGEDLAEALNAIGLPTDDLSDSFLGTALELEVIEGAALGELDDAKIFDLAIPGGSFVTVRFGPYVALVMDEGGDGVESFDVTEILGQSPAPGLSNYRVFMPSQVSEPIAVVLLGVGLVLVAGVRRRR